MPSVKFYLDHPKRNGVLRTAEVSIRVIFTLTQSERFELKADEKIEPKFWDSKSQSVKSSHRHAIDINNNLSDFKRALLTLWKDNRTQLTFEEFKKLAQRKPGVQKKTIFDVYEKFLSQHKAESDKGTFTKYSQLHELLKAFDKQKPFDLLTLDLSFYDNFKSFLFSQPNFQHKNSQLVKDGEYYSILPGKGMPVPLLDNTVYKFISNLKNFLNWCSERNYPVHQSYKKWAIITHRQNPISLNIEELEKLEKAILPSKYLSIARDYLVFECRTGQRISDIKRFNISQYQDGVWSFNRKKGNKASIKQVHVHFEGYCAPALKILEKYNFKLPYISDKTLSSSIKAACKVAGINTLVTEYHYSGSKCILISGPKHEFITTHVGRKTFITLGLQFMSTKIVKDLAGISDYKTLKHYEGESESGVIRQQLKEMDSKIKSA